MSKDSTADATFVTLPQLDAVVDKIIGKINELGVKVDSETTDNKQEAARLLASINNVQTQLLKKQGRFDSSSSSAHVQPPPPAIVHKLRLPKYDGADDSLSSLHKCEQYFRSQGTPEGQKVWTSFYLESVASQWYYRLEKNRGSTPSWSDFVEGITQRFGLPMCTNTLGRWPIAGIPAPWRCTKISSSSSWLVATTSPSDSRSTSSRQVSLTPWLLMWSRRSRQRSRKRWCWRAHRAAPGDDKRLVPATQHGRIEIQFPAAGALQSVGNYSAPTCSASCRAYASTAPKNSPASTQSPAPSRASTTWK